MCVDSKICLFVWWPWNLVCLLYCALTMCFVCLLGHLFLALFVLGLCVCLLGFIWHKAINCHAQVQVSLKLYFLDQWYGSSPHTNRSLIKWTVRSWRLNGHPRIILGIIALLDKRNVDRIFILDFTTRRCAWQRLCLFVFTFKINYIRIILLEKRWFWSNLKSLYRSYN